MKYEYIIVDSQNNWLDTLGDKKTALAVFNERKEKLEEEKDDTEIYLYQGKEIKRYQY